MTGRLSINVEKESEIDINEEQELIAKAIQLAASKHILSTKIQNSKNQIRKETKKSLIYSRAKVLGRIYRKGVKAIGQNIEDLERAILDVRIEYLNTEYKISISHLPESQNIQYCNEIREQQNILKEKV